jgi:glucoside 3-dehydrogenase (cytochrome c) hitch-hiker subunit
MTALSLTRREAIARLATLMGSTLMAPRLLSAASAPVTAPAAPATAVDLALLDEIGETIIPTTDIPGAKAVQIGAFIAMMVDACSPPAEQADFHAGVAELARTFREKHGHAFVGAPAVERTAFLNTLDREQRAYTTKKEVTDPAHYFHLLKELTILGYFSSEIGCTQALRFVEVPGSFNGSAPYAKGDHAWFS